MSKVFDEFDALAGELLDEFSIGEDIGELPVMTNPAKTHPVTGAIITPAETRATRCTRKSTSDYEGEMNVQLGDVLLMYRVVELRGFNVDTNTTVSLESKNYGVENVELSAKNIMITVQCRSI